VVVPDILAPAASGARRSSVPPGVGFKVRRQGIEDTRADSARVFRLNAVRRALIPPATGQAVTYGTPKYTLEAGWNHILWKGSARVRIKPIMA